jgi:hypothetical protein
MLDVMRGELPDLVVGLDEWAVQMMRWHFSEATGAPFWVGMRDSLPFDPLRDITGFDDLRRFGLFDKERLRRASVRDLLPRGFADRPSPARPTGERPEYARRARAPSPSPRTISTCSTPRAPCGRLRRARYRRRQESGRPCRGRLLSGGAGRGRRQAIRSHRERGAGRPAARGRRALGRVRACRKLHADHGARRYVPALAKR